MKSLPFLLACLLPLGAAAQSHTVAGRVVSAGDNAPLAGCSVVVKHTSRGTVTGPDGRYEIGAAPGDTLRFSFVGFRTAEEPVGRRTRIDVVLEAAAEVVFEECVVEVSGMQDAAGPVAGLSRRRAGSAALPFVQPGREEYAHYEENRFRSALQEPLSTFSLEADGASYAVCRRKLASGRHPEPDAVRIEELLNYFSYDYPAPEGEDPLSLVVDAGPCPWEPSHRLVRIGLRAREIPAAEIPPSNFIYLIDVSGSMTGRLPLVQASMKMLTDNLRPGDRVSVVTYADGVRVVSENVPGSERRRIKDVIDGLTASGSTAGGVKTVTVGVILLAAWSTARGRTSVQIMKRRIPQQAVANASALFILVLLLSGLGAAFLSIADHVSLENALYETISALCTVGLTTGITSSLCAASQIVLIIFMFFGRLGIMTISVGFMAADRAEERVSYAETKIMIG